LCNLISVGRNRKPNLTTPGISPPPERLELPLYYIASAFDAPPLPVLKANGEWELAKWGLVPHWTRTVEHAKRMRTGAVNARSESMWEKPAFEQAARNSRCLILVDGFFEFHHHLGVAFPFYVYLDGHCDFLIAGLRDKWGNPDTGETEITCTVVTTAANSFMSEIHNKLPDPAERRMPVIVPSDQVNAWLSLATPIEKLKTIVSTREVPEMRAHPVSRSLNNAKKRANDPSAQEPADYPELNRILAFLAAKR
jgi:putative SOS response-associated peptidase YedK